MRQHLASVSFDADQLKRLDARCRELRRSRSFMIRLAIEAYLRKPVDPALRREVAILDLAPTRRGRR